MPEYTVARVEPFFPAMGITRIANVTGLDTIGIPVVMVSRPNSRSLAVAQGKGMTLSDARASGVMESVETFHAERIEQPLLYSSYMELKDSRPTLDIARHGHLIEGGSPWRPRLWLEGVDLNADKSILVPYELVHLDLTVDNVDRFDVRATSNGLASGNTQTEATAHAICEAVERDAVKLWRLLPPSRQSETKIDLPTVDDADCRDLLDRYSDAGVLVAAWDCTHDLGLPTFIVRILNRDPPPMSPMRPASGMGCHPRREIALRRALTEAAQSRLTFVSGARDDMFEPEYQQFLDPDLYQSWSDDIAAPGSRDFYTVLTSSVTNYAQGLAVVLERLRTAGIDQVISVNLTKQAFKIPVTRVIIPALETISTSPHGMGPRAHRQAGRALQ